MTTGSQGIHNHVKTPNSIARGKGIETSVITTSDKATEL